MILWTLLVWLAPPVAIFILPQSPFPCFTVWTRGESVCINIMGPGDSCIYPYPSKYVEKEIMDIGQYCINKINLIIQYILIQPGIHKFTRPPLIV